MLGNAASSRSGDSKGLSTPCAPSPSGRLHLPAQTPRPARQPCLPAPPRPTRTWPPCSSAPARGSSCPSPSSARARPSLRGPRHSGSAAPARSRQLSAAAGRRGHLLRAAGTAEATGLPALASRGGRAAPRRAAGRDLPVRSWAVPPCRQRDESAEPLSKAAERPLTLNASSSNFAEGRRRCKRSANSPVRAAQLKPICTPSDH